MPIELAPLPYAEDALAPAISAETLATHHGKHHKAYVDKTNEAIAGTRIDGLPLEALVQNARGRDQALFNNAAQAWNHGFYWNSLTPSQDDCPAELTTAIDAGFGSRGALLEQLVKRGVGHFASGWVWLAADGSGALSIEETHDGDTLADADGKRPLLTIDLWEHAYYIDYKNRRPDHLEAVTGKLLNWRFAAENFARQGKWRYPG